MARGGDRRHMRPGMATEGKPGISTCVGRMLCPQCGDGLWLRIQGCGDKVRDIPAYTWDPFVSQGVKGLIAGKCHGCGQIMTAYHVRQRGKYGRLS